MYTCGGFILISGIKIDITLLTQMLMNLVATKIAQAWTSQTFNKYGSSVLNISTLPLSVAVRSLLYNPLMPIWNLLRLILWPCIHAWPGLVCITCGLKRICSAFGCFVL